MDGGIFEMWSFGNGAAFSGGGVHGDGRAELK